MDNDLIDRLRRMAAREHDDLDIGAEAADYIERRERYITALENQIERLEADVQQARD